LAREHGPLNKCHRTLRVQEDVVKALGGTPAAAADSKPAEEKK
jgi:hypothetical protein